MKIEIPVYAVLCGDCFDECEDSVIGTYFSKEEAERVLYKYVIDSAINIGDTIRRCEFDDNRYDIGSYSYAYIETKTVNVN